MMETHSHFAAIEKMPALAASQSLHWRRISATFIACFVVLFFVGHPATARAASTQSPADQLNTLFVDYWASEMREDPFAATSAGLYEYNARVPSVTPEDHARRLRAKQDFLERLDAIDAAQAPDELRLSADLLRFILRHEIKRAAHKPWRIPFLADGGFHSNIGYVVGATPFRTEKDYRDYLKRLDGLPSYLDQNVENMRLGLADGFTQPKEILPEILPSFKAQVTADPADHPLYKPFNAFPAGISERRRRALRRAGRAVLSKKVIPAYARVLAFMREEYAPGAAERLGAGKLPGGAAYYADEVRYYTTLDDATPEAIHEIGLKEVARIRAEMAEVIADAGFQGSFAEFLDFLRTDKQFYADSPEALLKEAAYISKAIDGKLPAYFGKLPRQPYSVEPVPADIAPNYTNARYVGAGADADRGGQFWVNTYNHEIRPLYQLAAMALHEAVPGHHLQIALSLEVEDAPQFRTQFYPHAFGEGWGLYAEKLGVEMGVYKTPYDHFGRLTWEMWRACRLVIDTGLHSKDWTRAQAIDYLASNTALSLHNVRTEVDRYIAWPGQALAYKMGELTIWELRAKAEKELGPAFDIRKFHDAILVGGGLPLELLRARIDHYIAETKAARD